jgi:hypothetical protein
MGMSVDTAINGQMRKSYDKLLKSKRWASKRKLILKRDNNACVICGSTQELCVHHKYYYKQRIVPWGYPDDCYITLCEDCHNEWHKKNKNVYIDNPNKSIKAKPDITSPKKQVFPKKKKKVKAFRSRGGLSLAEIQQNRQAYIRLKDGTWVSKRSLRQNNK